MLADGRRFHVRYLAAPAYVLSMMAVIFVPLLWQPYTGPAPNWFSPQKPRPTVKANKIQDRLVPRVVKVETIRK